MNLVSLLNIKYADVMGIKKFFILKRGMSLRKDFMFSLLVAMVPALLISLSFDYYYVYSQNMKAFQVASEDKMDSSVETLQKPLWQYNVDFLQNYTDVLINDPSVGMVTIYDERNREVAKAVDVASETAEDGVMVKELEREIFTEGRIIGRLIVSFNNSQIQKLSRQMLVSDVLVILAILLSVWAAIWFLVTRQVLLPLKIMKNSFHDISGGDYSKRVTLAKQNELTSIAREFNEMVGKVESRDKALRESEVKYRNLVESPSDIIFTMDNENRIVFINRNFEKWTGIDRETMVGKPFSEMFVGSHQYNDAELISPLTKGDLLWERELIKSDGSCIPVELNISVQCDSNGKIYGAIGIARDITTRMKAEEELRKYEQMVSSITDYLLLVDSARIIQAVNKAYLDGVGKERKELIGRNVLSVFAEQAFQEDFSPYFETCLEGSSVKHQGQFKLDGKNTSYMVITFYPLVEEDNSVSGVIVHMRDITERKKLEAMLQQSQKMEAIGTMAGGIAHDFNNIIGGIVGYAEMIEMFDAEKDSKLETRIQHVLKGAYRAKELVEQILTFSRNSDSKKKPLNLDNLVADTLQFLRASIPSTIEIVKQEKCPGSFVWADETSIQQILMNLCTNAAHAMKESGGKLTVGLCVEQIDQATAEHIDVQVLGAYVKLSVVDTGVGMDSEMLARIFEPFYTTKETGEGTGMGLAMVHGIVKELRGSIIVDSRPGHGSTFQVYLPQYDLVASDEAEEDLKLAEIPGGQENILIVDDEPELLGFSKEILEYHGYRVVSTTNSVEARRIFLNDPDHFDLVITDQTMPNVTGLELAKQFLEVRADTKIILCTGFSHSATKEEAEKIGVKRFVKKPFGPRQLAELVSAVLTPQTEGEHVDILSEF